MCKQFSGGKTKFSIIGSGAIGHASTTTNESQPKPHSFYIKRGIVDLHTEGKTTNMKILGKRLRRKYGSQVSLRVFRLDTETTTHERKN